MILIFFGIFKSVKFFLKELSKIDTLLLEFFDKLIAKFLPIKPNPPVIKMLANP